jgi:c-di-GMP-binding flagellar brake protein YcgR
MDISPLENLIGKERRKFPRYWIETRMSLSVEDVLSGEPIGIGEASDLSLGGLRVRYLPVHPQVDIGNRLGMMLMDEDIFLFVQAEIIHHGTKDSYGVEFRDLTNTDQKQLQRLVGRFTH